MIEVNGLLDIMLINQNLIASSYVFVDLHTDHFFINRYLLFLTRSAAGASRTEQKMKTAPPIETHTPTTEHSKYTQRWLHDKNAGEYRRCL